MINRVLVAGRIQEVQHDVTGGGHPTLSLKVLAEEFPYWKEGESEQCEVLVRLFGERRVAGLQPYLEVGRCVAVQGRLREEGGSLIVVLEQVQFLPRECVSKPLWVGAPTARAGAL